MTNKSARANQSRPYDYIILGSGIAGLYTALLAQELGNVLILTKGSIDDCNTKHAQGGIAAAIGRSDSPELHYQDTIDAGAGLCDPEAVRILVNEAPDRISDLVRLGVPFDTVNGEIALTKEAAHSIARILHAGGDATGEHIEVTLSRKVHAAGIKILEHCLAIDILTEAGVVQGVRALDLHASTLEEFPSRCVILATGGAGRLFKYTTNDEIATGDGIALAFRAGAEISDMEFFQFHPTVLRLPGVPLFLISEAVRGEGGILCNKDGRPFMQDYTPEGELASRDIVARSILVEMRRSGTDKVFLDVTHLSPKTVLTRFPQIYRFCLEHGLDITKSPIPVAPAAHYMMGGVKTNTWGETNIAGLFAVGEIACTGVHGANRLASNSLLEVVVFAKRIVLRAKQGIMAKASPVKPDEIFHLAERPPLPSTPPLRLPALESLMWDNVGILRSEETLEKTAAILATWEKGLTEPGDRPQYELTNMVLTGRLMTEAALLRKESRGAHFRSDFPSPSPDWKRHVIFQTIS
jgi:L-aspartate oxidase